MMDNPSVEDESPAQVFHSESIKFPFKITDVDNETNRTLLEDFNGERTSFVQVGPKKWFFPNAYKENAQFYYNFKPRPDDVWIVTFPRSGTTLTQELIWLLANDLNYKAAKQFRLVKRYPFLEFSILFHPEVTEELLKKNSDSNEQRSVVEEVTKPGWKIFAETTERRFIKTHLPFQLLPPNLLEIGCKVIYVARNPKDAAVSYYHLSRLFTVLDYSKDFARYWDYFEKGLITWGPYWSHIEEGWQRKNDENLLFMFYENTNKNLKDAIKKVSRFLGVTYSNDQCETLVNHLKIENFKKNKSVNNDLFNNVGITRRSEEEFVRKGKTGGWKDYFDDDLNKRADKWIDDNLKKTDVRFPSFE